MEKTPDKARSVDRFARYYLPEVVKLMGTYAALEQNGVRGENAAQIEAELRRNAETTATALKTSWMRSTAPRQWIFLPILRCWTVS